MEGPTADDQEGSGPQDSAAESTRNVASIKGLSQEALANEAGRHPSRLPRGSRSCWESDPSPGTRSQGSGPFLARL